MESLIAAHHDLCHMAGTSLGWGVGGLQGRLGPGRLHHCMRLIGAGERALELMASRAQGRVAFGKPLAANGAVLQTLAECRVHWEGARLLLLHAALQLDTLGNKAARIAIAVAKVHARVHMRVQTTLHVKVHASVHMRVQTRVHMRVHKRVRMRVHVWS